MIRFWYLYKLVLEIRYWMLFSIKQQLRRNFRCKILTRLEHKLTRIWSKIHEKTSPQITTSRTLTTMGRVLHEVWARFFGMRSCVREKRIETLNPLCNILLFKHSQPPTSPLTFPSNIRIRNKIITWVCRPNVPPRWNCVMQESNLTPIESETYIYLSIR